MLLFARYLVIVGLLTAVLAAPGIAATELAGRAKRAAQSGDLPGLKAVVRDTAEVLGRGDGLPAARLEDALAALQSAQSGLTSLRDRRENAIADDEAALDALYGSSEWLQMDHLSGEIDYWRGWVLFRLGHAAQRSGASRTRQRGYFQQALRAFGRALPRVRDPAVGRETLLAVASLQRGLGQTAKARATLDRLGKVFRDAPPDFHERVRVERARTAAAEGKLEEVLKETEGTRNEELLLMRLEAFLGAKDRAKRSSAISETAKALMEGKSAGQATAHLAAAGLDAAFLDGLGLGAVGSALAGLAAGKDEPSRAAAHLDRALRGGPLPGLRRDVVVARLAEAEYRAGRFAQAYAASQRFRTDHPQSSLRPDVARLAYDAARSWQAEGGAGANRAVADASAWVAKDAPDSAEAGEVAVHRALGRAAATANPDRAIRILERVDTRNKAGGEAVELQKALLLSSKLQSELERSLQERVNLRAPAQKLARALHAVAGIPAATKKTYAQELGLARARQQIAEGKVTPALDTLLTLRDDFETTRTRLVALWRVGRHADAQDRARRMLEAGPGAKRDRWQLAAIFAAVPPEAAPNPAVHAKLLAALRAKRPDDVEVELVADLTLREAEASSRAGDIDGAVTLLDETLSTEPRALGTLHGAATLFESLDLPDRATLIWHRASQLVPPESEQWAEARVGVARTLRAAPGKAQDGCAVAASLLASGRVFADPVRAELTEIADSCPG